MAQTPEERKRKAWDTRLRRHFNISADEYEQIFAYQDGVCSLCGKGCATGKRLAVDHDHVTGIVRGLLCLRCNKYRVGNQTLQTVSDILRYLSDPPAVSAIGPRGVPEDMVRPKKRRRKRRAVSRRRIN